MKATETAVAWLKELGSAVRTVLAAAHSKKEMIDLRREKLEELFTPEEDK